MIFKKKKCYDQHLCSIIYAYDSFFRCKIDPYNSNLYRDDKRRKINKGHFLFVPKGDIIELLKCFENILNYLSKKNKGMFDSKKRPYFLDAGCGIGNIMMLADRVGFDAFGIEYDHKTFKIAQKIVTCIGIPLRNVIRGDIATYEEYYKYNVIYSFIPIKSHTKQNAFMQKLANTTKVGTITVTCGGDIPLLEDDRFEESIVKCRRVRILEKVRE